MKGLKSSARFFAFFCVFCAAFFCFSPFAFSDREPVLRMFTIKHGSGRRIYRSALLGLSGNGRMRFDPATNIIAVYDKPSNIAHIQSIIESMDVVLPKVELFVRVAEVDEWFIERAGIRSSQAVFARGTYDNIYGMLDNRTNSFLRSEKSVITVSGEPVKIDLLKKDLYGGIIGSPLEILPVVNNDGMITIKIRQYEDDPDSASLKADPEVFTQVTVKRGDLLVVGGAGVMEQAGTARVSLSSQIPMSRRKTALFLIPNVIY